MALIYSCKKEETKPDPIIPNNTLPGGKGGDYAMAFFSKYQGRGKASRIYIKYGADKQPSDTTRYDEALNTMVEPGFGPHVHFENLKTGTYYIHAQADALTSDTVVVLTTSSKKSQDLTLTLK